jgi:hypothetical protein
MKFIKELLFGIRRDAVCQINTTFHTFYPSNRPDEWTWMKEFRVGMMSDRKTIYLN